MGHSQASSHGDTTAPALLSADSVAEWLNCSTRTVMRCRDRGELRRVRIGKLVRFRPEDLEALIRAHSESDTTPLAGEVASNSRPKMAAGHDQV